jgi:hypothetical protein
MASSCSTATDPSTACITVSPNDTAYCNICQCQIVGSSAKAVKQHLKSRTHKANLPGTSNAATARAKRGGGPKKPRSVLDSDEQQDNADDVLVDAARACGVCQWRCTPSMSTAALLPSHIPNHQQPSGVAAVDASTHHQWCLAPQYWPMPRRVLPRAGSQHALQPFVTRQCGSLHPVPESLEHALHLFTHSGGKRMPNIDVNQQPVAVESWAAVRRVLLAAAASEQDVPFWAAFGMDQDQGFVDPEWWSGIGSGKAVPGYRHVIVSHGAADIGCHNDNYGSCRTDVHTYLTMVRGRKRVMMIPPHALAQPFHEAFHVASAPATTIGDDQQQQQPPPSPTPSSSSSRPTRTSPPFPRILDATTKQALSECGGFYFDLSCIDNNTPLTLFIPKGWHHWLEGAADWAVLFSSSLF